MKVFKEEQLFRQTWLIALLIISLIAPIIIVTIDYNKEDSTMSTNKYVFTILFMILILLPIFFFKLKTRIDEKGIHYQFFPIHFSFKTIQWNEIEKAHVRNYDAITEFGGWGFKGGMFWNKKNGKAINVSGDIGIQLKLKTGKKLLIGTQKKEDASRVLKTYLETINE